MINPELKMALLKTKLCKHLELQELDMLLNYSRIIIFNAADMLLQQGKRSDGVYIVMTGAVSVLAKVIGVGVINLATLSDGDFVGESGLIVDPVSAVSVIAKIETKCIFIPNTYFAMLGVFSPETKHKINVSLIENVLLHLQMMHSKITQVMHQSKMLSISIFDEVLHSLTNPKKITLESAMIQVDQLQRLDFFRLLSEEDFLFLLQYMDLYDAPRHCPLIKEGEKTADFYLILRGAVLSSVRSGGKAAKLSVLSPFSVFCGMTFHEDMSMLIDFTTCEHAIFLKIPAEKLAQLKNTKIDIWYYLYDAMCRSWANLAQAADKLDIRLHSELYNR